MTNPTSGLGATNGAMEEVKPKKKKRVVPKKGSVSLKMVISRTFSEGAKRNIGNYQSRDFFASATRSMEIALPAPTGMLEEVNEMLFKLVRDDVKAALKVEMDDVADTKGELSYVPVEQTEVAPSIPDAFTAVPARKVPWNKFKPREDNDDLDVLE